MSVLAGGDENPSEDAVKAVADPTTIQSVTQAIEDYHLDPAGAKWGPVTPGTGGGIIKYSFWNSNFGDESFPYSSSLTDKMKALVRAAFSAWSSVANIDFQEVPDSQTTDQNGIRVGLLTLAELLTIPNLTQETEAAQIKLPDPNNVTIRRSQIAIASDIGWHEVNGDLFDSAGKSFTHIVLHEIGHSLGLGHWDATPAVMNQVSNADPNLKQSDIDGASHIYGPVQPHPNLIAWNFHVVTTSNDNAPWTFEPGKTYSVTWSVTNVGNAAAGPSSAELLLTSDPANFGTIHGNSYLGPTDYTFGGFGGFQLAAGATTEFRLDFTIPSTLTLGFGTYYLGVVADFFHEVPESNENDNVVVTAVTITAPRPDLIVSSLTPTTTNQLNAALPTDPLKATSPIDEAPATSAARGTPLNFTYVIKNQSSVATGLSYAGWQIDHQPSTTSYINGDAINSLAANATASFTRTLDTSNLSVGTHKLWVAADNWNGVAEGDETNNLQSFSFTVTAPISKVISSGQIVTVYSGQTETSATVLAGGYALVSSGGTASSTMVNGGSQVVYAGGTASNTVVKSGSHYVMSGASAGSTTVSGGTEGAFGTVSGTTIMSGGLEYIYSGGRALGATLSGGYVLVQSGGTAGGTTVKGGGQVVYAGGTASGTVLSSGGVEYALAGGTTIGATVLGGSENIFGAGTGTILRNGGVEFVFAGGSALGTTVSNGYELLQSGGKAIGTTVLGGAQLVYGSAVASSTVVNGGAQYVMSGGTASGTTVSSGSVWIYGTALGTTLKGGNEFVNSGASASGSVVSNGGYETVSAGGTARATTLRGGQQIVYAGANVSGVTVNSGIAYVLAGATATGTVVNGGTESVYGKATSTTVKTGGFDFVYSGAVASGTTLSSGGDEIVYSGGVAIGTVVSSGGQQIVLGGGAASSTQLGSGGLEYVMSGGAAVATMISGGVLEITSGGTTGPAAVTFALSAGGILQLDELGALRRPCRRLRQAGLHRSSRHHVWIEHQPDLHLREHQQHERNVAGDRRRAHRQHHAARPVSRRQFYLGERRPRRHARRRPAGRGTDRSPTGSDCRSAPGLRTRRKGIRLSRGRDERGHWRSRF